MAWVIHSLFVIQRLGCWNIQKGRRFQLQPCRSYGVPSMEGDTVDAVICLQWELCDEELLSRKRVVSKQREENNIQPVR
jgi:hypothetical protein